MQATLLDYLNTPYRRRLFFGIALLMILLLALLEFLVLPALFEQLPIPPLHAVLSRMAASTLAAAVASVVTTTVLLYFSPPPAPETGTTIVRPSDRGRVIESTRQDADNWWFSGGLGRYTRTATLPKLAGQAIKNNRTTAVTLHLLDLHDEATCEACAQYRQSAPATGQGATWTRRRVELELATTLIAAALHQHAAKPRLTVEIRWRPAMSVFRIDLGARGAIMTQEDQRQEALFFGPGSGGYLGFREQLRVDDRCLRSARMPGIVARTPHDLTENELRGAIPGSDLEQLQLTAAELTTILGWLRAGESPYS